MTGAPPWRTTGACPRSNPLLAGSLTVFLLSQAGIPFTAGFFAKFLAVDSVLDNHIYWLAIVAMLSSAIAAFLYLRIVVLHVPGRTRTRRRPSATSGCRSAPSWPSACAWLVTIGVGIMPELFDGPADHGIPYLVEPPAPTAAPVGK